MAPPRSSAVDGTTLNAGCVDGVTVGEIGGEDSLTGPLRGIRTRRMDVDDAINWD
jgi:hypothetical protein